MSSTLYLLQRSRCILAFAAVAATGGCSLPGRPSAGPEVPRPQAVLAFDPLYKQNCAACHGADGQNGSATNLANPEYQALIDDATLRDITANGEKGSLMPGFAVSAGGMLTDAQVDVLVHGMRERWSRGDVLSGLNAPSYKALEPGVTSRGNAVYVTACARCHGQQGQRPGPAGNILDGAFLSLVSAQTLRTTVIAGRPDLGQPDWRGDRPGQALNEGEVSDLVAWMTDQRPAAPGRPYPSDPQTSDLPGRYKPTAAPRSAR